MSGTHAESLGDEAKLRPQFGIVDGEIPDRSEIAVRAGCGDHQVKVSGIFVDLDL